MDQLCVPSSEAMVASEGAPGCRGLMYDTLMYDTKQTELCPAQPDTPLVLKVESDIFL